MELKPCPVCGNEPMNICYTTFPPKFGYAHCGVYGGYGRDWHEAKTTWNNEVDEFNRKWTNQETESKGGYYQ